VLAGLVAPTALVASTAVAASPPQLRFDVQPTTSEKNTTIDNVPGNAAGSPVKVGVYSGDRLMTSFNGVVTLSIVSGTGTPGATLLGQTSTAAAGGVAEFPGINIDRSGENYQLRAQARSVNPGTSAMFDIVDDYQDCMGRPCTGSAAAGGTSGNIVANTVPTFLTVSILPPATINCANYQEITGTVAWKTDDRGNQVGTITADKSLVKTLRPPDQGAAHFQVCYSPDPGKSFVDRDGVTRTSGEAGLLPDCESDADTNCVFFRNKTGSGTAIVQFRVADGKGRI
jgi:hypothetical protein